jgi:hypothetical protein
MHCRALSSIIWKNGHTLAILWLLKGHTVIALQLTMPDECPKNDWIFKYIQ